VHVIVFQRGHDKINPHDVQGYSYEIDKMNRIDISSTEMRTCHKYEKTKNKVKEYIDKNELYN
jgi:nicotinic acid mononucleotide adenylyltransferase